jgi:tRNA dimethylallyltransferase
MAVRLAETWGAEIVNVDAFQVYKGLGLLTAMPEPALLRRVPHHLIGILSVAEQNNVARFVGMAHEALAKLAQLGKPAVVVSGAGFYIRALQEGLSCLPSAQPDIRKMLENLTTPVAYEKLQELDAKTAQHIDRQNRRRVVRALEVCLLTGKRYSDLISEERVAQLRGQFKHCPIMEGLPQGIFLNWIRPELHLRIAKRVDKMFDEGVVEEVRALSEHELGPTAKQTLGLKEIHAFLRGEITESVCRSRLLVATRQYAKRQITWFKKMPQFQPVVMDSAKTFDGFGQHLSGSQQIDVLG